MVGVLRGVGGGLLDWGSNSWLGSKEKELLAPGSAENLQGTYLTIVPKGDV